MPTTWRLVVPVAFAMAGVLFATSAGAARGGELRGGARTNLPQLIRAEQQRGLKATKVVERLRGQVDASTAASAGADRRVRLQVQAAETLSLAAGSTAVEGPGLTVTLDDAPRAADRLIPDGTSPDDLVVHQQDVQAVVNALWAGGAEAMQIMDQRVISTSAVRCVGNTLILQGRVYSPPYVIKAIGKPEAMEQALAASKNVQLYRYYVRHYGLIYRTSRADEVRLPAYEGPLTMLYAEALR